MKLTRVFFACLLIAGMLLCIAESSWAFAGVPVRVSIKFILDANGNRPATGNINTDAEITAELDWGNWILRNNYTEFQIDVLERIDLSGVSQYYSSSSTVAGRDALRNAAQANTALFHWRNDAINIYINGGTGSAISDFPPNNNMILMNQGCGNTPSCILHELGHSFNLMHTHEGGGADGCADTIADNASWNKDQIAQATFGTTYANLTAAQQDQVNLVFNNVMSYHVSEPQLRLSPCQMNRESTQLDNDRARLLSLIPTYVNWAYGGAENGRFTTPYNSLQEALNAGINGKVVVLQAGSYTTLQSTIGPFTAGAQIVPRSGISQVNLNVPQAVQLYVLPTDLENSKDPAVSKAVRAAQDEDKEARKAIKDAEEAAGLVQTGEEKAALKREGKAKAKVHEDNALGHLEEAQKHATGDEKLAVQFELAQRYQQAGNCEAAIAYYRLVAEGTDQAGLRDDALRRAEECSKTLEGPAAPNN